MRHDKPEFTGRAIVAFLLLVFGLSLPFEIAMAHRGMQLALVVPIMFCPAAAAFLAATFFGVPVRSFGWKLPSFGYAFKSYATPFVYITAGYVLVWVTAVGRFYNPVFLSRTAAFLHLTGQPPWLLIAAAFVLTSTVAVLIDMFAAVGEEIGWRGFLVPALFPRFGFTGTALLSGTIWAIWHYPGIFWSNYNGGNEPWYAAICFTILIIAISFPLTWLRMRSGSLWTGVIFHAVHNALIQAFFNGVTLRLTTTRYFIDEFGVALLPFAVAVAVYFIVLARRTPGPLECPSAQHSSRRVHAVGAKGS